MSKLNITRNIFLEKEELNRFQNFLANDTIASIFLDNTTQWGIVRTSFSGPSIDFLIEQGTNVGAIKISNLSKAVDIDRLLIYQKPINNIPIPSDSTWYWVKISHKYDNIEEGECSININGEVSGINTKFSEVLRGHSSEVPVKIKFFKESGTLLNDQIYEVVSLNNVSPDLNCLLVGSSFVSETGLRYCVIGSTPVFEAISEEQEQGLYFYDSCKIELIVEEVENEEPATNYVENKDFYIARVRNSGGSITIQDKRSKYWTFNIEGIDNKLDKGANLSDLSNVEEARNNLGVLSASQISSEFFGDSGWKDLTPDVAAGASNFNLKIRRLGKVCYIQGTFQDGNNPSPNANIAYIDLSELGPSTISRAPSVDIYFLCGLHIDSVSVNRGMTGYVKKYEDGDTKLFVKVHNQSGLSSSTYVTFNINLSFVLG